MVVIPPADQDSHRTDEDTLDPTDVGEPVEKRVAISCNDYLAHVHLNGYVNLHYIVFFIRPDRHHFESEHRFILKLRQLVKVEP